MLASQTPWECNDGTTLWCAAARFSTALAIFTSLSCELLWLSCQPYQLSLILSTKDNGDGDWAMGMTRNNKEQRGKQPWDVLWYLQGCTSYVSFFLCFFQVLSFLIYFFRHQFYSLKTMVIGRQGRQGNRADKETGLSRKQGPNDASHVIWSPGFFFFSFFYISN